jgi:hypothetical protein
MEAKHAKSQVNGKMTLSAGAMLRQLELLAAPDALAVAKLVADHERLAVQAIVAYDTARVVARIAIENARAANNALAGFARACLDISRIERFDAVEAYEKLDRANLFKFSEHIEGVFVSSGLLGKVLGTRLGELRTISQRSRSDREAKQGAVTRAERTLSAALFRLRGSLDAARSVLQMHGVSIGPQRSPARKKLGPQPSRVDSWTATAPRLPETSPANEDVSRTVG